LVPGFSGLRQPGRGAEHQLRFISLLRALVVPEQARHWVTFTFNTSNNRALKASNRMTELLKAFRIKSFRNSTGWIAKVSPTDGSSINKENIVTGDKNWI